MFKKTLGATLLAAALNTGTVGARRTYGSLLAKTGQTSIAKLNRHTGQAHANAREIGRRRRRAK